MPVLLVSQGSVLTVVTVLILYCMMWSFVMDVYDDDGGDIDSLHDCAGL